MALDPVDGLLLIELMGNCRVSYSKLAKVVGLTVNGVKKRVAKLIERGVIRRFYVAINLGLCFGGKPVTEIVGWVKTDGSEAESPFIQELGAFPTIEQVMKTTSGVYGVFARVPGFEGYSDLVAFLEGLDGVTKVNTDAIRPLPLPARELAPKYSRHGYLYDYNFTQSDLLVLRCLKEDPRMSISKIATRAGLTPKRVRKVLDGFAETRAVVTQIELDEAATGYMNASLRIRFDVKKQSAEGIRDWVFERYPQFWAGTASLVDSASTVFQFLLANNIYAIEEVTDALNSLPGILEVDTVILYRTNLFPAIWEEHVDVLLKQLE